jgi:uncharacterized membrane protein YbaN (DUF454 family)
MSELTPQDDEVAGHDPEEILEPLPLATRIAMWIVGSIFLLLGLIGLALPVVPQAVPLALGVAFLSLASERFYALLVKNVERWPRLAHQLARLRATLHRWLSK